MLREAVEAGEKTGREGKGSNRVCQVISENRELGGVEREIGCLDRLIGQAKEEGEKDELMRLYELKTEYMEQREWLRVKQEKHRFSRTFDQLNELIEKKESTIACKNQQIRRLKGAESKPPLPGLDTKHDKDDLQ